MARLKEKVFDDLWYNIIKEYQKIINLLENTPNEPKKYKIKIELK